MKNLKKALQAEAEQKTAKFLADLKKEKNIRELVKCQYSYYGSFIPKGHTREFATDKEAKEYLVKRYMLAKEKNLKKELARIDTIAQAQDVVSINITMEWKKSRIWGMNPSAEAFVRYANGTGERFNSGPISGCGYDKGSTAVANCLNQVNGLLKRLYAKKDKRVKMDNHEFFGYGSGYGLLPSIEGGVGVSCYDRIMKKIGLSFQGVAHGKTFDVYEIK